MRILDLIDLNRGETLKQGDSTLLRFQIADRDQMLPDRTGEQARVVFMHNNSIVHEEITTVLIGNIVEFSISEILPPNVYSLEIHVGGQIFPSDEFVFKITRSALNAEHNIIKLYGVDNIVDRAVDEVSAKFVDLTKEKLGLGNVINVKQASELEVSQARGSYPTLAERLNEADDKQRQTTAQLAQTKVEAERKRRLEDLEPEVLAAIEGGEGTSFNLLSIPQPKSVTPETTTFFDISTNLYDDSDPDIVNGFYVNQFNGNLAKGASYRTSGFIPIKPNTDITIKKVFTYAIFDSEKNRLRGSNPNANDVTINTGENAAFIRVSWNPFGVEQQVNVGTALLPYEPFYKKIKQSVLDVIVGNENILDKSVDYKKTDFVGLGKNLFDKSKAVDGKYVNHNNGVIMTNAAYWMSAPIDIEELTQFTMSSVTSATAIAFYNEHDVFISGALAPTATITSPVNAKILRVSNAKASVALESFQLEQGSVATSYEEYGYKIPRLISAESALSNNEAIAVFGAHYMRNFLSQASKYRNPSFDERLEVAIIGDSWVRSGHRIASPLRKLLIDDYGDAGIGYTGFTEIRMGNGETITSTTGLWESTRGALNASQFSSSEIGATIRLSVSEEHNEIEIHHKEQVGSYRYRINEGSWNTVDTATSPSIRTTFALGSFTLDIEVLSGTVTLLNAYLYKSTKGAVVHKLGNSGAMASRFLAVPEADYISELEKSNFHAVGILLGTNENSNNISLATYKENITSLINRVKAAKPLADVFLIAPSGNNLTRSLTMQDYSKALLEIAKQDKVAYVSLYETMGDFDEQNARGLFEDDVHPNVNGGYVIANSIYQHLFNIK